jgi:thiol-disulfide isomerase/thioredoxin
MRLGRAAILVFLLALAGCKGGAPKPFEKKKDPATPVTRTKGATPAWLEDSMAKLPGAGTGIPKGGTWGDHKTPGFENGLLAGRVLDQYGKGAKNVFIRIEPADATSKEREGSAVGILTNEAGFFMVKDLPAGRAYVLTAEAKTEGKPLFGVVQTKPPQSNITIALRDDLSLPSGDGLPPSATAGLPAGGGEHIPSTVLPMPGATGGGVGGWAPGVGSAPSSIPATIPGGAPPPTGSALPPPSGLVPSIEPRAGVRPESTATGEAPPWRPPAASIPGPGVPTLPPAPPGVPTLPGRMSSQPRTRGADIALVDSLERPWTLATRSGSLVLLDFMSTNCIHCKRTIPVLTDLQSRYSSSGLELIGVLCDDVPQKQRAALAARYQRDNALNYAVYVEAGAEPGAVRDRFNVESYPTVVLLNGDGAVLWQGHPSKKSELEAALRRHLGK